MSERKKKGLLSDRIADILSTTPGQIDPEDDIYEETTARVTTNDSEDDIDTTLSKFRTQNVALLEDEDKRYIGKKSSRKSLRDSEDEWETEDEGLSTDEGEALDGVPGTQEQLSEENTSSNESENEENSSDDSIDEEENLVNIEENDDFKHISESSASHQIKKGNSVRNQLNVWENLLEIRIQLQKCLLTTNKFPQTSTYKELKKETQFKEAVSVTKKSISNMLNKFLQLQSLLLKQYGEIKNILKIESSDKDNKKKSDDEEILSDTENEETSENEDIDHKEPTSKKRKLNDFEADLKLRHQNYKSYRNSTIQKWNDKTRLAVGKNTTGTNTVLQQIDYLLTDKQKLLKKSQLKKCEFEVVGKKQPETDETNNEIKLNDYDTEIYDDTDFYHQLLRELIEVKSSDVTDPIQMSRQWIAIQNLRSKMKRKIDTKTTKGRKIRYVVHSKLVNFMAPVTENCWTNEAKNELYSSLFGKNQSIK